MRASDSTPCLTAYVDHRRRVALLSGDSVGDVVEAASVWHARTSELARVALRGLPAVVKVAERQGGTVRVVHLDGSHCTCGAA